ncbi:MAG TPA: flagellar type III secretion system pore protein FliP [Acidimicrobiales bacterium]|nr:flagellar type III secretion system pore protein FliP [Acidimicrobiales bacterium]
MQISKKSKGALAIVAVLASLAFIVAAFAHPGRASASPAPSNAPTAAASGTSPATVGVDQSPSTNADQAGYTTSGSAPEPSTLQVTAASPEAPQAPASPATPSTSGSAGGTISVNLGGGLSKPSESITIIIALTLLAVAPSLLILLTSFTRIIIVLSLTRQALGLTNVPPNQLLAGLALFLSLFIMSPVIGQVNSQAVQPYMAGKMTAEQAYTAAELPIKTWMLKQTQVDDLAIFEKAGKAVAPQSLPMSAVVPAFALSEMRSAFIIGFVVFVPFLVIDLVVSATLMSLGMMMLPPSLVSLPFKLLLFVLVNGWALVVQSLLTSFHT